MMRLALTLQTHFIDYLAVIIMGEECAVVVDECHDSIGLVGGIFSMHLRIILKNLDRFIGLDGLVEEE
jgi:hypothetical protein